MRRMLFALCFAAALAAPLSHSDALTRTPFVDHSSLQPPPAGAHPDVSHSVERASSPQELQLVQRSGRSDENAQSTSSAEAKVPEAVSHTFGSVLPWVALGLFIIVAIGFVRLWKSFVE